MSKPVLQIGSRGPDVLLCQERLTLHGFPTSVDGVFGSGTQAKVMQFQRALRLGADGSVGAKTWEALLATPLIGISNAPGPTPPLLAHVKSLGHEFKWRGDHHLLLFGIRAPKPQANSFDDIIGAIRTEKGIWQASFWPGTTDPGTFHLQNPSRVEGTAILREGFYENVWEIDLHNGQYEALCQRAGDVEVYRDSNKNGVLDMDPKSVRKGMFGINIHRSSIAGSSLEVGKWSAGCQVHATLAGFNEMMGLAKKQVEVTGLKTFSYCLMNQWW